MDLQTRKIDFIQEFLKVESEELISRLENLLQSREEKNDDHFQPMTMGEFNDRIDRSMEDVKNGKVISQEDLLKEIDTW